MRVPIGWVVRTVGAPVLFGAITVSLGTVAYVLFCPGLSWAVRGQPGQLPPFLVPAAVVGALAGAALGLCIAADRAARDPSGTPTAGPAWRRRRPAASAGRLRHPAARFCRERRRLRGRAATPGTVASGPA